MGFKTPTPAPIEWVNVKMPDPEDDGDALALLATVILVASLVAWAVSNGWI